MQVALRWFCSRSLMRQEGLTKELIDRIPGKQTDRKTPLGELNWIFTAITDTIAWNMLPRSLFQRLFRQASALSVPVYSSTQTVLYLCAGCGCTPASTMAGCTGKSCIQTAQRSMLVCPLHLPFALRVCPSCQPSSLLLVFATCASSHVCLHVHLRNCAKNARSTSRIIPQSHQAPQPAPGAL